MWGGPGRHTLKALGGSGDLRQGTLDWSRRGCLPVERPGESLEFETRPDLCAHGNVLRRSDACLAGSLLLLDTECVLVRMGWWLGTHTGELSGSSYGSLAVQTWHHARG